MRFVHLKCMRPGNADLSLTFFSFIILLSLSACTTNKAIRTPVVDNPTVKQAQVSRETERLVRWGGIVIAVENKADHTRLEIVERPVTRYGTPKVTNASSGRFFAKTMQFIDPETIKTNQAITVSGTLIDYQPGMIGEHEYIYPVVEINEYKLWPENRRRRDTYYRDPFWYDPYWGHHPYWYHGFRYRHRYRHW